MNYRVDYNVITKNGEIENYVSFEADNDVEALYKADKILEELTEKNEKMGFNIAFKNPNVSRFEQVEKQEMMCLYLSSYQHTGRTTEQWLSPEDKEYYCNEGGMIAVTICTAKEFEKATLEELETYRKIAFEKLSALEREKPKSIGEKLSENLKKSKAQERDC